MRARVAAMTSPIRSSLAIAVFMAAAPLDRAVTNLDGWKSDLELFRRELPDRHKNLFFRLPSRDFRRSVVALEAELPRLTDDEAFIRLQKITAAIGDDHTTVALPKKAAPPARFPIEAGWFRDGIFVTAAPREQPDLLGARLVAIGAIPIAAVVERLAPYVSTANAAIVKHRLPTRLNEAALLKVARLTSPSGTLTLTTVTRDRRNLAVELATPPEPLDPAACVRIIPASCPTIADRKRYFFITKLDDGKTLYAQYNRCWGRELEEQRSNRQTAAKLPSIKDFFDDLVIALRSGQPSRLIFDLRWNSGGSSAPGSEFIGKLLDMDGFDRRGTVFVLIGRQTFSSAILNAAEFAQRTHAVLVGEPTGGTPSHFGEVLTFELPHTGITVGYSTKYFDRGSSAPLAPDVIAWQSFDDYQRGTDPAIEAIRRMAAE